MDASKLFVKCDMVNIQAFVDNIVSNAVRYTDPTLGVEIRVEIDKVETMVRFRVRVQDYCPGAFTPLMIIFKL